MERETRTIQTPAGKDLVLKTFLTVRERNAFRSVFIKNASYEVDQSTGQANVSKIAGDATDEAERRIIEIAVVSYDGKTEGIVDLLLDSTDQNATTEYDFIAAEAMKAVKSPFPTAK